MFRVLRWALRKAFLFWLIAMCCVALAMLWAEDETWRLRHALREWRRSKHV